VQSVASVDGRKRCVKDEVPNVAVSGVNGDAYIPNNGLIEVCWVCSPTALVVCTSKTRCYRFAHVSKILISN